MKEPIERIKEEIKITAKELERFRRFNLINENALRNIYLKKEYRRRIKEDPHKKRKLIKEEIVTAYNKDRNGESLTPETFHTILFRKCKPKKAPLIKEII